MTDYQFYGQLGAGGFGVVYEVERTRDGLALAGKALRRGASQRDRRRFEREVRLQAKLDHPNIVPIVAMNLDDDPPWFVMPVAQENLREHLARLGPGEDRLWVFEHVAAGLAHAHENGILHRDVKPENVLLFENEPDPILYAALADFGLGKFRDRDTSPLTSSNTKLGTVAYAAPEQWSDAKNVDERADVYALGKLLYELLVGEIPYPDSSMRVKDLPAAFGYVVEKATETNRDHRYSSVRLLLEDVHYAREASADLKTPAEAARGMVQEVAQGSATPRALIAHVLAHLDDTELMTQVVPRIPALVVDELVEAHLASFRRLMEAFGKEMAGSLPFSYCDVVADFYEVVFQATEDRRIRSQILRRLPSLGYEHNRWHVGAVFGRLVATLEDDPSLIMLVRDTLRADPEAAAWCAEYLQNRSLPTAIREAAGIS